MLRRLVLDTNVWLDWLVFGERGLAAAHAAGAIELCIDADCEAELARALGYRLGRIALDAQAQSACLARCRALARRDWAPGGAAVRLPDCRDPDDQKFLALALACGARALLTRDRALLETGRRWKKSLPFAIVTPRAWAARHKASGAFLGTARIGS
ncbi:MAG: PIN domain-containing protein [Burkholderiales bacterium]|nr:PIN domain-containing protein [Burkholderiales bacterium]